MNCLDDGLEDDGPGEAYADMNLSAPSMPIVLPGSVRRPCGPLHRRLVAAWVALVLTVGLVAGCGAATNSTTSSPPASTAAPAGSAATGSDTAAVGTCPTSNTKTFAKTKFVLHAGLAFGAFHRYLYKPFRAGSFSKGAHGRFTSFVKAGLATVFIEHEIRLASGDVQANPTLCKLIASPLRTLSSDVSGAVSQLRSGSTSAIEGAQSSLGSITSLAKSQGTSIVDNPNASIG